MEDGENYTEKCLVVNGCESKMLDYIKKKEKSVCSVETAMEMIAHINISQSQGDLHYLFYNYEMVESTFCYVFFSESCKKRACMCL